MKLGIFYVVQNILLGSPNYKIEDADQNVKIPDTTGQFIGYGAFVLVLTLLMYRESCAISASVTSFAASNVNP